MRKRMINIKVTGFAVLFAFSLIGCNNSSKKVSADKTLEKTIEQKLNKIIYPKDPKILKSSITSDYIGGVDSNEDYKYIVSQGKKSLNYMLNKFASSNENGLEEYIMAMACTEILNKNPTSKNWVSGREWYDNYKAIKTSNFLDKNIYGNDSIRELLKLTKEQDISYAGKFIDEKGILNIALVYKTAKNIELKDLEERISNVNNKGVINIINAQFSLNELQSANKTLVENMKKLGEKGLISFGIDEKKNRITVTVKKVNIEIKNEISELIDMSLIILEEGLLITLT